MTKLQSIRLSGGDYIEVETSYGPDGLIGGHIKLSTLKVAGRYLDDEDRAYNAAVDGMESLILAQACVGMDVEHPDYVEAVNTAFEAINNNF